MSAGKLYYEALVKKYEAEIAGAKATLATYFNSSVGIGEHSDLLEEFDKHLEALSNAEDKLEKLKKHFNPVKDFERSPVTNGKAGHEEG